MYSLVLYRSLFLAQLRTQVLFITMPEFGWCHALLACTALHADNDATLDERFHAPCNSLSPLFLCHGAADAICDFGVQARDRDRSEEPQRRGRNGLTIHVMRLRALSSESLPPNWPQLVLSAVPARTHQRRRERNVCQTGGKDLSKRAV